MSKGPILIDLEGGTRPAGSTDFGPDTAPPVPDLGELTGPQGRVMRRVATVTARPISRLVKWFWALLGTLITTLISLAAWDYAAGLMARAPVLGMIVSALLIAFVAVMAAIAVRELAGFVRLARMDRLQAEVRGAMTGDLAAARLVLGKLEALYARRPELDWHRAELTARKDDAFDAAALLDLAEANLMVPLDALAQKEVEAAARQVAMVTALVPLALADVITALTANLRMVRRIAEIYGGRSGTLGSWRLIRAVMTHLVATGAVAMGDDMIGSLVGGGLMAKLSRRFGEGVVNGALTARVGLAAIEVCRPMPFSPARKPSVSGTVKRALTGLFGG